MENSFKILRKWSNPLTVAIAIPSITVPFTGEIDEYRHKHSRIKTRNLFKWVIQSFHTDKLDTYGSASSCILYDDFVLFF